MPLRVLMYPPERRRQDPYTARLREALTAEDVDIEDYTRVRAATGRHDMISVHHVDFPLYAQPWPRAAYRASVFLVLLRWAKLRRTKVVWSVHNLEVHELRHGRLARWYFRRLARLADAFVSLCPSGVAAIEARHPGLSGKPHAVVPLGHYQDEYPTSTSRAKARSQLGIDADARVIVFIGQIRPYKGVPDLVDAFGGLEDPDAVLLIAGQAVNDDVAAEMRVLAAADSRVRLHLGFIEPDTVQTYLRAADLAVLPFRRILNSSSALLALSFDLPVLVPDIGGLRDLRDSVGADWVRLYERRLDAAMLSDALDAAETITGGPSLDAHNWDRIGAATAAFYREVAGRRQ